MVLFAAALMAHLRLAGTSPVAFDDTFNDESEVRACVRADSCTLVGMQTSIPGLYHGVGWLELRTLLAWLGADISDTHLLVQVLNALAVVLVYDLATSLAGPLAGVAAVWVLMDRLEAIIRVAVLYNSSLLLFLGTVFLLACTAAAVRPGLPSLACAALVAAVLANTHLACAAAGISLAWVALVAPRHRLPLALFALALFAAATFALAPPGWLHDLAQLVQERGAVHHPTAVLAVPPNPMLGWALFGIAAWLVSFAVRTPRAAEYRRNLQGAVAIVAPFLAAFLVAPRLGLFPEPKYLIHLKAAGAVAAAVPLATLVVAPLQRLAPRLLGAAEVALPFGLAALLVALPRFGPAATGQVAAAERVPTYADLVAAAHVLVDERGWDADDVIARLRSPDGIATLTGLRQLTEDAPHRAGGAAETALLLTLPAADVAATPPAGWRVLRRAAPAATVLIALPSRLDWSDFEACAQARDAAVPDCARGTLRFDAERGIRAANMPPGGGGWRGTVRLLFAVPAATPDFATTLFMPRLPGLCGGRIRAVHGTGAVVAADARRATIAAAAPDGTAARVELEWDVGGAECEPLAYDGLPPFFVESEQSAAAVIEEILRHQEKRRQ